MKDISTFIAFIVVYAIYISTSYLLLLKYVNRLKDNRLFENELLIVIPNIFLFAFLFIIGRFFNINLVLFSIAFSNIGLFLVFIMWSLIGSPKVPYKAVSGWAGYNFAINNLWLGITTSILSAIILHWLLNSWRHNIL